MDEQSNPDKVPKEEDDVEDIGVDVSRLKAVNSMLADHLMNVRTDMGPEEFELFLERVWVLQESMESYIVALQRKVK